MKLVHDRRLENRRKCLVFCRSLVSARKPSNQGQIEDYGVHRPRLGPRGRGRAKFARRNTPAPPCQGIDDAGDSSGVLGKKRPHDHVKLSDMLLGPLDLQMCVVAQALALGHNGSSINFGERASWRTPT